MDSCSQAKQDMFVQFVTGSKRDGAFLEIGSNDPVHTNNTYALETKYGWRGIMVEYDGSFLRRYQELRKNSVHMIGDARTVDYVGLLDQNGFHCNMDYLQVDLDVDNGSTIQTLELLNNTVFDKYRVACITFEHDYYTGDFYNTRQRSREIFAQRGYTLLFPDITISWDNKTGPFEDWYVHPDLVCTAVLSAKTDDSLSFDAAIQRLAETISSNIASTV